MFFFLLWLLSIVWRGAYWLIESYAELAYSKPLSETSLSLFSHFYCSLAVTSSVAQFPPHGTSAAQLDYTLCFGFPSEKVEDSTWWMVLFLVSQCWRLQPSWVDVKGWREKHYRPPSFRFQKIAARQTHASVNFQHADASRTHSLQYSLL